MTVVHGRSCHVAVPSTTAAAPSKLRYAIQAAACTDTHVRVHTIVNDATINCITVAKMTKCMRMAAAVRCLEADTSSAVPTSKNKTARTAPAVTTANMLPVDSTCMLPHLKCGQQRAVYPPHKHCTTTRKDAMHHPRRPARCSCGHVTCVPYDERSNTAHRHGTTLHKGLAVSLAPLSTSLSTSLANHAAWQSLKLVTPHDHLMHGIATCCQAATL
jgi:hypothetical protein